MQLYLFNRFGAMALQASARSYLHWFYGGAASIVIADVLFLSLDFTGNNAATGTLTAMSATSTLTAYTATGTLVVIEVEQ